MTSPAGKVGEILPEDGGKLFKPDATVRYSFHVTRWGGSWTG